MRNFARELDPWITREQPEPPTCACGNDLHCDDPNGLCRECVQTAADRDFAEAAREVAARVALDRTLLDATRIAYVMRRLRARDATRHVELALDHDAEAALAEFCPADEALFVGSLTEADLDRLAADGAPAYAVAS